MRSKFMDVAFAVDDLRVAHHRGEREFGTLPQFAHVLSKGSDGSKESALDVAMPAIQMNLGMPPCPSTYRGSRGKPGGAARPDMLVELETSPLHIAAVVPHLIEVSTFFDLGLGDKIDLRSLEDLRAEQWQKMRARFSDAAATTSAPTAPELRINIGGIYCSAPADAGADPAATMVKVCLGSLAIASDPSPAQCAAAAAKRAGGDSRGGLIADLPAWSACYPADALAMQVCL